MRLVTAEERAPALDREAFICPYCEAFAHQSWTATEYAGTTDKVGVRVARCRACKMQSIWLELEDGILIWPVALTGEPPSIDMPDAVTEIYNEARSIANYSPRAASALLRLALEALLGARTPTRAP